MLNGTLWILRAVHHGEIFQANMARGKRFIKEWPDAHNYRSGTSCLKQLEKSADSESISIEASYVKLHQHGTGIKRCTSHKRSGEVKAD
jgi:hypothetical protein